MRIGQTLSITSNNTTGEKRFSTVAAESGFTQEDIEWLAKMIYCEARGESLQGQIAVGSVIFNRVKDSNSCFNKWYLKKIGVKK